MAEPLLNTTEAAKRLGVSRRSLEDWRLRGGGPPYVKLRGSMVRYQPAALDAFIEASIITNTGGGTP